MAANVLIVSDPGNPLQPPKDVGESQKEELIRNLDFFREKARDFLITQFVSVEQASLQFGTTTEIRRPLTRVAQMTGHRKRTPSTAADTVKSPISRFLLASRGGRDLQVSPS